MCKQTHRILGATLASSERCGLIVTSLAPSVPASEVAIHGHTEAHLVCVTRGRYQSEIAGDTDGALLLFHPSAVAHRDRFHETQRLSDARFFALTLGGDSANWCDTLRLPLWSATFHEAIARQCALALQTYFDDVEQGAVIAAQLDLQQLVAEMLGHLACDRFGYERVAPGWFSGACEALVDSHDEHLSLSALAALANVHPVYFARVFRRIAGCSPGEYRRRYQLNRALVLLRAGRRSLTEIAHESGFYDHAHFTRQFRARFGVAPSTFLTQVANVQDGRQVPAQN